MNALEAFLTVDPRDAGCGDTLGQLHVYAEDRLAGREPDPAVSAHLRSCPPCAADLEALLRSRR